VGLVSGAKGRATRTKTHISGGKRGKQQRGPIEAEIKGLRAVCCPTHHVALSDISSLSSVTQRRMLTPAMP